MESEIQVVWYGLDQLSNILHSGTISFLAVVVLMVLIGAVRYYINKG
jgi:hypothetical protein